MTPTFTDYSPEAQIARGFRRYYHEEKNSHDVIILDSHHLINKVRPKIAVVTGMMQSDAYAEEYNRYDCTINCNNFNCALDENRIFTWYIRKDLTFGCIPPDVSKLKAKCVWDCIKDCPDPDHEPRRADVVRKYLSSLPSGYSLERYIKEFPEKSDPAISDAMLEMYRLQWRLAAPHSGHNLLLHPGKPRFITLQEYARIFDWPDDKFPTDAWAADVFPVKMSEWVALQCYYALRGDFVGKIPNQNADFKYLHPGDVNYRSDFPSNLPLFPYPAPKK